MSLTEGPALKALVTRTTPPNTSTSHHKTSTKTEAPGKNSPHNTAVSIQTAQRDRGEVVPTTFTANATCTVWDRPPNEMGATAIRSGVPIRQLKPWGPYNVEQASTSILGFLYRWIVFSDYVPPTQKTSNLAPRIFFATVDGAPADIFYQGAWSQLVMAGTAPVYTYMVLRAVDWIGGGASLMGGAGVDRISGQRYRDGDSLVPARLPGFFERW